MQIIFQSKSDGDLFQPFYKSLPYCNAQSYEQDVIFQMDMLEQIALQFLQTLEGFAVG